MSKLLQKQEAKTWPFFFKGSRYSRTRNKKIISRTTPMVFLAQVCLLPRQTQETCLVFSPSPLRGGISYIPWCTASYNIIKLSNAHDPISSTGTWQLNNSGKRRVPPMKPPVPLPLRFSFYCSKYIYILVNSNFLLATHLQYI